jgi:hypothetical protein
LGCSAYAEQPFSMAFGKNLIILKPMIRFCFCLPFLLAACGPAATDPGPGGVTVEDARALDDAAAKLDEEAKLAPAQKVP